MSASEKLERTDWVQVSVDNKPPRRTQPPAVVPEPLEDETLVTTISLSANSELRARLYTFKGNRRADLRLFAYRKKIDAWIPTRRGVSVPLEQVGELLEAAKALVDCPECDEREFSDRDT